MERAPDTHEAGEDRPGIIRQPHAAFDVATADAPGVAEHREAMQTLREQGCFDIETYRKRGAVSRPAS